MKTRNIISCSLLLPLLACVKPGEKNKAGTTEKNAEQVGNKPTSPSDPSPATPSEPEGKEVLYPTADAELGEVIQPDEIDAAKTIAKVIEEQIRTKTSGTNQGARALRDAHPKQHGCVRAKFEVDPSIDPQFAYGVFAKGNKFDAIIRYSNSSHIPTQADIKEDGRGMAMKLFNVPGKKLLETESQSTTQDFILISHPVFFTDNPKTYIDFISNFENSGLAAKAKTLAALGIKGAKIASDITSLQVASPITTQYFSNVPYQLGAGATRKAVKYTVKACGTDAKNGVSEPTKFTNGPTDIPKSTTDVNYLRTRLVEHFKTSDACMEMFVQFRESSNMSVENSMDEWTTPWHKVATIRASKADQTIAATPDFTIATNQTCDSLSFNPWHSLPEHKPLGSMNRIRKVVYEHISKLRHQINSEPFKEATSNKL